MDTVNILNIPITTLPRHELLARLSEAIAHEQPFTIFTPNPEILVKAHSDQKFSEILQKNELNIPDGVGITLFTKIPAIKGRTFMRDILKILNDQKQSCYLVGATNDVIEKSLVKMKHEYPNTTIFGHVGPHMDEQANPLSSQDIQIQQAIEQHIQKTQPTVVFVAFGAPKQEYWINTMKQKFPTVSFMAVGGALDTYSGVKELPPDIFSRLHLEWLFRLFQEPKRLRRILTATLVFPFLVLKER